MSSMRVAFTLAEVLIILPFVTAAMAPAIILTT